MATSEIQTDIIPYVQLMVKLTKSFRFSQLLLIFTCRFIKEYNITVDKTIRELKLLVY